MSYGQHNPQSPYSGGPAPQQQPPYGDPYAAQQFAAQQRVAAGRWNGGAQPHPGTQPVAASDQNAFITRVFAWMTMGLGLTGFVSWTVASSETLLTMLAPMMLPLAILTLVMVFGISWGIQRIPAPVAGGLFLLYASLLGVVLAPIFLIYTGASIASTFFVTTGTFGFMFVWGWVTKKDLTAVGSLAFMGLIGVILASLANFWLKSPMLHYIITYVGVLVFVGLIAYDAQKLKAMNQYGANGEIQQKNVVLGALTLYLDFINLFIFLLRILGDRR